jgi:hypothetical protein
LLGSAIQGQLRGLVRKNNSPIDLRIAWLANQKEQFGLKMCLDAGGLKIKLEKKAMGASTSN